MRVDPQVNRLKYEREVQRLVEQRDILESRGLFTLSSSKFPFVDVLVVPRHPLRVAMPPTPGMKLPPRPPNVPADAPMLLLVEVPSLAGRAFKARFDLSDYDLRAPSLDFRDPWTDELLTYGTMFRALEFEQVRRAHLVLLDDHPITHKPFLCLRGIREYHEHPQHSGDDWMLYRQTMSLFSIIMSLWRTSVDLIHPQLVNQPQGLQVLFQPEEKL